MAIATAVIGGVSAAASAAQAIKEAKDKKAAAAALANLQAPPLNNVADKLQVSTLGSDLQKEEQARLAATQVEALRGGGTRALIGGLGRVEAGSQQVNQQVGATLDQYQKQIDQQKAEDDARIRSMNEQRYNQDAQALSSQYNAANQNMNQAIGNVFQGAGTTMNNVAYQKYLKSITKKDE